jgi:FtsP/CotA-like multicopper oxidase with cupredoxin domain
MSITRRALIASALLSPIEARARTGEPRIFDLRPGKPQLAPAPQTDLWTINGQVPGPVLRVKQGEEIFVRLINNLRQPVALHWQGVRIANGMDGAVGLTQAPVEPGRHMDIRFTAPDAGTYWYRPSAFPHAAEQKARGIYGLLIVDGRADPPADQEVLAVIDDWGLDEGGRIGSLLTVNAQAIPQTVTARPGARVRLRLLNACSARIMSLSFEGLRPLVVGIDGQSCEPFEPARMTLPSGPGSRFDVMFDLPREGAAEPGLALRDEPGAGRARRLITFRTEGDPVAARGPILSQQNPALPPVIKLQAAKRLDLTIEKSQSPDPRKTWTLNGVASHGTDALALFKVKQGQPVTLGFINRTGIAQTIHVHGHALRVLHLLDDGWEPYWRDSVIVPPGGTVRVAFLADNPGKWLIESAILEHAMNGLAAWFEVG